MKTHNELKICFSSTAMPWFFGPYSQQLNKFMYYLLNNTNAELYFLPLKNFNLSPGIHNFIEFCQKDTSRIDNIDVKLLNQIKFIGGLQEYNKEFLVSDINNLCKKFGIDVVFFLTDLTHICTDNYFIPKSVIWYPNHLQPIEKINQHKLSFFDIIISLSPSDSRHIKERVKDTVVEYVPHVIELQPKNYKKEPKYIDKFIIFINTGNYEIMNRKSLDTSILAVKKALETNDNLFLIIHTYDVRDIDIHNKYTPKSGFFEIEEFLEMIEFPMKKIQIINKIIPWDDIQKLIETSDVCLQASKTEGFGMPILEAQLLGKPVITTKFGAMADFTYYGIAVPPIQTMYNQYSKSFWTIPDINGISDAILRVADGKVSQKEDAIQKICQEMSSEKVFSTIMNIILNNNKVKDPVTEDKLCIIEYSTEGYWINNVFYKTLLPFYIQSQWTIFIEKDKYIYNKNKLEEYAKQQSNNIVLSIVGVKFKFNKQPKQPDVDKLFYLIRTKHIYYSIIQNLLPQYMKGHIFLFNKQACQTFTEKVFLIEKK